MASSLALIAPELVGILTPIAADLDAVEAECTAHLQSTGVAPEGLIGHIAASRGRLLRAAVLLIAARSCGYRGEVAVQYATVFELIHRATLIHQTLTTTPGLPTRKDRDTAVLLGDLLYVTGMRLALAPGARDIVMLICDAALRTFEGELYRLTATRAASMSESCSVGMIERTAAPLFASCAEVGARLGRADAASQRALSRYGFNLGVAYQLVHDGMLERGDDLVSRYATNARRALSSAASSMERGMLDALLNVVSSPRHRTAKTGVGIAAKQT